MKNEKMQCPIYNIVWFSISWISWRLILFLISIFCFHCSFFVFAIMISIGFALVKFCWNLVGVSKKLSLIFFARKGKSQSSETLKKEMTPKNKTIMIARTIPRALASAFAQVLNVTTENMIQTDMISIWIIEIEKEPMEIFIVKIPFSIFCGKITFFK